MSDQFSAEYDELINDIQGSGYQTFPHNLGAGFRFSTPPQTWLAFLRNSSHQWISSLGMKSV